MSDNPYDSPAEPTERPAPKSGTMGKPRFSFLAARLSLYGPFVVFLTNYMGDWMLGDNGDMESGIQLAWILSAVQVLIVLTALVLGIVGLVVGMRSGSRRTVWTASLGVFLNVALIVLWIWMVATMSPANPLDVS